MEGLGLWIWLGWGLIRSLPSKIPSARFGLESMTTRCKEMEAEFFTPHPEVGYGESRSGVHSAPEHGCFTIVSPMTTSFEGTGGPGCDMSMRDT